MIPFVSAGISLLLVFAGVLILFGPGWLVLVAGVVGLVVSLLVEFE